MNFTSQICTTKEQSERLLALGLRKETADMKYPYEETIYWGTRTGSLASLPKIINSVDDVFEDDFPAWSLHRLIEIYDKTCIFWDGTSKNPFDDIILRIEYRIKCGELNKEYLN